MAACRDEEDLQNHREKTRAREAEGNDEGFQMSEGTLLLVEGEVDIILVIPCLASYLGAFTNQGRHLAQVSSCFDLVESVEHFRACSLARRSRHDFW